MTSRRWATIAAHELRVHLASPLFWVLLLALGFATLTLNPAAMIPSGDAAVAGVKPFANSAHALAQVFALSGFLFYPFFAAIMAGMSIIRDDEAKVAEVLHSTPLRTTEYVIGKLAGVAAALALALAFQLLAAMVWLEWLSGSRANGVLGPFVVRHYLVAALLFALPGTLLYAGLAFAVGARTRQPLAVYAVPTLVFFLTLFVLSPTPPAAVPGWLAQLLLIFDPSGLHWLREAAFATDRGVAHYNAAPLPLDLIFLLNRLVTLGLPVVAVLGVVKHLRANLLGVDSRSRRTTVLVGSNAPGASLGPAPGKAFGGVGELRMASRPPGFFASVVAVLRGELRELLGQPGLYVFVPFVMMMLWEYSTSAVGAFDEPLRMTAGGLAVGTFELVSGLVCLMLLFSTVESLDRERRSGLAAILFATPVSTGALLIGKGLANLLLGAAVVASAGVSALAILLMQPGGRVEVWPLVLVWGGLLLPTLLFWIAFVSAVYALATDRFVTYAVGLFALALTAYAAFSGVATWLTNWPLWAALHWSDLATFDLDGRAILLNRLLVVLSAVALAVFAARWFARRDRDAAGQNARWSSTGIARGLRHLGPWALPPLVVAGILAADIAAGHEGGAAKQRAKEYWRRNVATWGDVEPAALRHVELQIELEPSARKMAIAGTYTMVNETGTVLTRLPFTVGAGFADLTWTVDGAPVSVVDQSGLHLLTLSSPLAIDQEVRVGFRGNVVIPRGASRNGSRVGSYIAPSGVLLDSLGPNLMPLPGFQDGIGIDPANDHAPAELSDDAWPGELEPAVGSPSAFTTRIEVTAPSAYTVNSVGEQVELRVAGGSTTRVWESRHPLRAINLVAGRWAVERGDGVAVFHHPGHHDNVAEITATLAAAKRRYAEWFLPYPWSELRINELPSHRERAQGFPSNMNFSEGFAFLTKSHPGSTMAFVVTAHEAAHQWWGNLVVAGQAPGADFLIESLANYATLLLLDAERGDWARRDYALALEKRYASRRRVDRERPLTQVADTSDPADESVIYDKGAWVLWMLHHQLGREAMLTGLGEFARTWIVGSDHPAVPDLIAALRPHATDQQAFQAFVDQWIYAVVMPELRVSEATAVRVDGGWDVVATIENIGTGTLTVEVAVVGESPGGAGEGDAVPVDSAPRMPSGAGVDPRRVTVELVAGQPRRLTWLIPGDERPRQVVVDPDGTVFQLNRSRAVADL